MTNQEEIQFLIQSHGIKPSWLADKLGMKLSTLTYLVKESPEIDSELYEKIVDIIDTYQYEFGFIEEDKDSSYDLFDDEKMHFGIGERIRIFAKKKYTTLKSLADAMQISPQQLQQYISGKREPGSRILIKFLKLGCDINWLLGGIEKAENYRAYKLESDLKKYKRGIKQMSSIMEKLESVD